MSKCQSAANVAALDSCNNQHLCIFVQISHGIGYGHGPFEIHKCHFKIQYQQYIKPRKQKYYRSRLNRIDGSTSRKTLSVCIEMHSASRDGIPVDIIVGARQSGPQPGNPAGPPSLAHPQIEHGTFPMFGPRCIHPRAKPALQATSARAGWYADMDLTMYIGIAPLAKYSRTFP